MSAAGKFKKQINNIHISNALDHIPTTGIVNKKDYDKFIEEFKLAFVDGGDGIATVSRLLAMKRPDYFICLNSKNRNGLRKDFNLSSNIRYEEYWNNLITILLIQYGGHLVVLAIIVKNRFGSFEWLCLILFLLPTIKLNFRSLLQTLSDSYLSRICSFFIERRICFGITTIR